MSDTRANAWNHLLWPILVTMFASVLPWHMCGIQRLSAYTERIIVYVLAGFSTIAHIHYGQGVVSSPSELLNTYSCSVESHLKRIQHHFPIFE